MKITDKLRFMSGLFLFIGGLFSILLGANTGLLILIPILSGTISIYAMVSSIESSDKKENTNGKKS